MSIIEPEIDVLLSKTDNDRFLLCTLASKRARYQRHDARTARSRHSAADCC